MNKIYQLNMDELNKIIDELEEQVTYRDKRIRYLDNRLEEYKIRENNRNVIPKENHDIMTNGFIKNINQKRNCLIKLQSILTQFLEDEHCEKCEDENDYHHLVYITETMKKLFDYHEIDLKKFLSEEF
jgi:hypothetical protein